MRKRSLAACLLGSVVAIFLLTGCAGPGLASALPVAPSPAEASEGELPESLPGPDAVAPEPLPPPVVVTVPAGETKNEVSLPALQVQVDPDAGDEDLPEDVVQIIQRISRGEYVPGDAGGTAIVGEPTVVFHDLNGDGVQDEIIILVADGSKLPELDAFLAENGAAASIAPQTLGEGVAIRALLLEPGVNGAKLSIVNPDDPLCCPAGSNVTIYKLEDGQLRPYVEGE